MRICLGGITPGAYPCHSCLTLLLSLLVVALLLLLLSGEMIGLDGIPIEVWKCVGISS